MIDCFFCSVVSRKEQRVSIVYEDELMLVMMSPSPANPGHVLILPREHIESLAQMDENTGMHMLRIAMRTRRAIGESGIKCDGSYLSLADGEAGFQIVPHVYMDLVPRFRSDHYWILANIDEPYAQPDALFSKLFEDRARRWRTPSRRALADESSPEELDELAGKIRSSYEAIWGSAT
jgi:diadenosine tetraphosphate (Ap4A) HIT family hydrolase